MGHVPEGSAKYNKFEKQVGKLYGEIDYLLRKLLPKAREQDESQKEGLMSNNADYYNPEYEEEKGTAPRKYKGLGNETFADMPIDEFRKIVYEIAEYGDSTELRRIEYNLGKVKQGDTFYNLATKKYYVKEAWRIYESEHKSEKEIGGAAKYRREQKTLRRRIKNLQGEAQQAEREGNYVQHKAIWNIIESLELKYLQLGYEIIEANAEENKAFGFGNKDKERFFRDIESIGTSIPSYPSPKGADKEIKEGLWNKWKNKLDQWFDTNFNYKRSYIKAALGHYKSTEKEGSGPKYFEMIRNKDESGISGLLFMSLLISLKPFTWTLILLTRLRLTLRA